jgi:hypothetical protein
MLRYNLIDGQMVEDAAGKYAEYADVVRVDIVAANTLLTQLASLQEQIEEWYGE